MANMFKCLKCADKDDIITMKARCLFCWALHATCGLVCMRKKAETAVPPRRISLTLMQAEDTGDSITFLFESPSQDRHSDFELKLMDIDSEQCACPPVPARACKLSSLLTCMHASKQRA